MAMLKPNYCKFTNFLKTSPIPNFSHKHMANVCTQLRKLFAPQDGFYCDARNPKVENYMAVCDRALQAYINTKTLREGQMVHAHMIITGYTSCIYSCNRLLDMYIKCGSLVDARQVFEKMCQSDVFSWTTMITGYSKCGQIEHARQLFDEIPDRNMVSWNAMIAGFVGNGFAEEALELFYHMQQQGTKPNSSTMVSVISACSSILAIDCGKQAHAYMLTNGIELNVFVCSALVDMYAKCHRIEDAVNVFDNMPEGNLVLENAMLSGYLRNGSLEDACKLFDQMYERNVKSWTSMIMGYAHNGHGEEALNLFFKMLQAGMKPDNLTFAVVLSACASLATLMEGKAVHAQIIRIGFESYLTVGNALITLYAKCGFLDDACQLFDNMVKRDIVSWTAMIAGYSHYGHLDKGLKFFCQMLNEVYKPDQFALVCVLLAFTSPAALKWLLQVHAYIIQIGNELNVLVASALVDAYAKCGNLEYAQQLFDRMPTRNVDSWNALISGYAKYGRVENARELFNRLHDRDIFSSDCSKFLDSDYVIQPFDHLPECSWNAIGIGHYQGKNEAVSQVFKDIPERNVVSWTIMIAAYAQLGYDEEAMKLFFQMQQASMKIGPFIFSTVLSACASSAAFEPGRQVHGYIIKTGNDSQLSVSNSLVTMYAKCGSMDDTYQVFFKMPEHNVVSWTAMICACAQHGFGREAIQFFELMVQVGVKPDHVTFSGVLSACSHAGLVDEGHFYFNSISEEHGLRPNTDHYTCMIDLLGRVGNLNEAENLINNLPHEPDARMWGILLGACKRHGNIEIGKRVADCLIALEPHNTGTYVMLSNMYAAAGRWNDVAKVRKMMKDRGVKKEPGCSWIQIRNRVHTFVAGDRSHPLVGRIYSMLEKLQPQMEAAGYLPDNDLPCMPWRKSTSNSAPQKSAICLLLASTSHEIPI